MGTGDCWLADGSFVPGCRCFTNAQRHSISTAIVDLKKCHFELTAQEKLIHDRLQTFEGAESLHWWQTPTFVWGGITVSFAVGTVLGYFAAK